MKNSLRKLRGFALHKHDVKDRRDVRPLAQLDELSQASQDMQDMKDCYDSLLAAAAATANSAYEFSESLREMGACLLEKTALNDDEESGKVLLMLGKVQFELQLLVDSYRSHIFKTITSPSESLLNELRTVEEMKRQCEEKRDIYEYIRTRQREKGRSRSTKGESFTLQQLQTARDEYDEEATLFVFRLKSLKQGQSRSLLTQAARHHAAQLFFFKKALKSLEAVEPHVKWVTENQHIDYHFNGLEDDDGNDDEDVSSDDSDSYDDGELSFDYGKNDNRQGLSALRRSMELDQVDVNFPQVEEAVKENIDKFGLNSFSYKARTGSQSAPLFSENKYDTAGKITQILPSVSRKFCTYALPTPADTRSSNSAKSVNPVPGDKQNLWHSTPLEPKKYKKLVGDEKTSGQAIINDDNVLKESNNNGGPTRLPPPTDRILLSKQHQTVTDAKKIKAFSGPLTGKSQPSISASASHPQLFSGPLLRNPPPRSTSPVSPKFMSSPKINELHELPRPPTSSTLKSTRPSGFIGHSSPLMSKDQQISTINKKLVKNVASPLPAPPQTINRSVSVPSRDSRERFSNESKLIESAPTEMDEDIPSPTLAPIRLSSSLIIPSGSPNTPPIVHVKGRSPLTTHERNSGAS